MRALDLDALEEFAEGVSQALKWRSGLADSILVRHTDVLKLIEIARAASGIADRFISDQSISAKLATLDAVDDDALSGKRPCGIHKTTIGDLRRLLKALAVLESA